MRIALIVFAVLPLFGASYGIEDFSGHVVDGENRKIGDAIITVSRGAAYVSSVLTDHDGAFSFSSLPVGEYDLRVTAHGYAIYERQVTIGINVGLKELAIRLLVPVDRQTISVQELQTHKITQMDVIDRRVTMK